MEIDVREGWILESRIDQQGGAEVGSLPVHSLLYFILNSASLHGFLRSFEIMQESSSVRGREIFHKPCDWGWTIDMWVRIVVSDK